MNSRGPGGYIPPGVGDALLGLAAGLAAGLVMTRWGLCFNRALRQAAFERRPGLLRAFGFAVAVQLLLLPLLIALGAGTLERNADAGGPALLPVAQLAGGLVFGAGMALAGGCVTGIRWKAGSNPSLTGCRPPAKPSPAFSTHALPS